jgi:hypothetical protein
VTAQECHSATQSRSTEICATFGRILFASVLMKPGTGGGTITRSATLSMPPHRAVFTGRGASRSKEKKLYFR